VTAVRRYVGEMSEPASPSLQVVDLPRVNEISRVLARNGFGHLLELAGIGGSRSATPGEPHHATPFARRLRDALVELGPTFVKLGQVLSVRPDILPRDVLAEFTTLQDRVPPMPFEDVRGVVEQELQRPLEEVFEEFDETPLGSASIAQVHRARLQGGQLVAVKLQRKGIERTIRSDISILYTLANIAEGRLTLPGLHTPRAIVREFDHAISQELDFLQELRAVERMARQIEPLGLDNVGVPKVYPEWSTRRMLLMELIEGVPLHQRIAELDAGSAEARRLAHTIMDLTYRMVFDFGYFHGDPHPGNLMVTADKRIVLLDFGVTGTLTGAMQDTIVDAFTAMVFRDPQTLAMTVYRAGATTRRIDIKAFVEELERKMLQYYGASLDELARPATLMEVVELCTRYGISLPPEFAILSRAMALIEASVRGLLPGADIVEEVKPYAQRLMTRRFTPERVAHDVGRMVIQFQGHFRDLPTQFNQAMMDLQSGNVTIITRNPDAGRLMEEIRAAVLRLSMVAAGCTLTLGSFVLFAMGPQESRTSQIFAIVALSTGMFLFGALGLHVAFARAITLRSLRRAVVMVVRFFRSRGSS
jgi:ubiquinone biosynthesis protein